MRAAEVIVALVLALTLAWEWRVGPARMGQVKVLESGLRELSVRYGHIEMEQSRLHEEQQRLQAVGIDRLEERMLALEGRCP
jgi:hypothetical protein